MIRGRVLDLRLSRASGRWFVTLRRLCFFIELEPFLSGFYWFNQEDWIGKFHMAENC